jgi:hypothetical protein
MRAARLLRLAHLAQPTEAETPGVLTLVDRARRYVAGVETLLDDFAGHSEASGWESEHILTFKRTWICVLGWDTCVTGLVKDFVLNYFGRSSFHDHNGRLLGAIRTLIAIVSEEVKTADLAVLEKQQLGKAQRGYRAGCDVIREAQELFHGGPLGTILDDLTAMLDVDGRFGDNSEHVAKIGCKKDCAATFYQILVKLDRTLRKMASNLSDEEAVTPDDVVEKGEL